MIVAAAGTFLVQSWEQVGDVTRYLALLGMTALLPALAYICGIRLQEGRTARVLMLTLLALVPIHAGLLGGFVLSQFGTTTRTLGPVAQWVAPSPQAALLLVAGAAVALIPLIWAAFRVLSRPHARLLSTASAASHALLLVPDRSALAATLIIVPMLGATAWCAARIKPQTLESRLAVASLVVPAAVLAARQVLFYDVSSTFWGTLLGTAAIALFTLGKEIADGTIERFAIVPTLLCIAAFIDATVPLWAPRSLSSTWLIYGLFSAVPLLGFAWTSVRSKAFFLGAAVILNATTATTTLLLAPRAWAALEAIALGLGVLSYGFVKGRRVPLYAGIALAGFGFVIEVVHAIEAFEASGWLALASFGAALLGLSAWLERRARSVRHAGAAANLSRPVSGGLSQ